MKTAKKTRAEIQRAYRQRLMEQDAEGVRERERRRWHSRRCLHKVKTINDMTERQKRSTRRTWRSNKAKYRSKLKKIANIDTPCPSVDGSFEERKKRGRAKLAYRQTKAYRQIAELTSTVDSLKTSKEKYKKRWMRLKFSAAYSNIRPSSTLPPSSTSRTGNTTPETRELEFSLESSSVTTENSLRQGGSRHGNALDDETVSMITSFYTRDDNSRVTTGKKTDSYQKQSEATKTAATRHDG